METALFEDGGYRYVRGPFQYSSGVAALPGFRILRFRFARPLPVAEGFDAIRERLTALGRPLTAFCACELRSPAPFSDSGFIAFNRHYVQTLEAWGLFRDEENPVARSNVCPVLDPPAESVFHAFCCTVPDSAATADFVISGGAEARPGTAPYAERIVRLGDHSETAMAEKIDHVLASMEARMAALDTGWSAASATQVYCPLGLSSERMAQLVARGAAVDGIAWTHAHPPVEGLVFEMDVRGLAREERF